MGDSAEQEASYWPLFRAAVAAALVALAAQVVGVVWFGLQQGAEIGFGRFYFVPYLRVVTVSVAAFNTIVTWSTLLTALAVAIFAAESFFRGRRLQTQMGRAFGFVDLGLLAGLHLWGERIDPGASLPSRLMLYVLGLAAVGFGLSLFLVSDAYRERQRIKETAAP